MTDERGVIRSISWRDLFPWLILLRTFRIAIHPPLLAVATAAVLLTSVGWWAGGWMFLSEYDEVAKRYVVQYPAAQHPTLTELVPPAMRDYLPSAASGLVEPFLRLAEPWRQLFQLKLGIRETAYYVFGSLVALAVWSLAGGFITRHAVQELAEHEPDLVATARFAGRRYLWYFLAPLYPLLGVLLIGLPIALLGIPIYFSLGVGSIIAGLLWIFVVVASVAAAWLLIGLLFGWPLMWPAVSAERDGDAFEAFSRSFAYVYGRPLNYFFYVVVAALFGALCLALVHIAALLVTEFGFWALAWGAGGDDVAVLRDQVERVLGRTDIPRHENQTLVFGAQLMAIVVGLVRTVESAYMLTYFWCVASAIYLLMRMDVDDKEMDEIHLESDPRAAAKTVAPTSSAARPAAPATAAPLAPAVASGTTESPPAPPPEPIDD